MNCIHTNENAIFHACGYSNDNAVYLSVGSETFLITDSRYTEAANKSLATTQLIIDHNPVECAATMIAKSRSEKIYFDPKEWSHYAITLIEEKSKKHLKPKLDLSHTLRMIKSDAEIKKLSKAVRLGKRAFSHFAKNVAVQGIGQSEKVLHYLAKECMEYHGKYALSFDPIVAIGPNAAMPHALPTRRKLHEGDLLLFDAGLKYQRYCSDRTRTVQVSSDGFGFGKKRKFSDKKIQKAYDVVRKAQENAITKARSGMRAKQIDALARDVIEKAGFGKWFVHSTGHGVGLDIHEMPYISGRSETRIKDGMVFTIEPGIYLPRKFGIRIEDMVVMRNGVAHIL